MIEIQGYKRLCASLILMFAVILEVKVPFCISVRDVLDHLVDEFHFALRKFALLEVLSEYAAEDAAEIFMARV